MAKGGKVLAVVNQKGGVGKTSTTYHLGCAAVELGYKTLLVEADQQSSLSLFWGLSGQEILDLEAQHRTLLYALLEDREQRVALPILTRPNRPDLVASGPSMGRLEKEVRLAPERALFRALSTPVGDSVRERYDLIIIDTPAGVNIAANNGMAAATDVLIPCAPQYLAYAAAQETLRQFAAVREILNPELRLFGIVPTIVSNQTHDRLIVEQMQSLAESYGSVLWPGVPQAAVHKRAVLWSRPVWEVDPVAGGRARECYVRIVEGLMD
jgi:chromosome partitioning protein